MSVRLRDGLPEVPARMRLRPVSQHGFPVPWFVAERDGDWDFRVVSQDRLRKAVRNDLCWCCGHVLGRWRTFIIGPMCTVNRVSSEPGLHRECAEFSLKCCPFLTEPRASRREGAIPEPHFNPAGIMLKRNPGLAITWTNDRRHTGPFQAGNGVLMNVGAEPKAVAFWCRGRKATPEEIHDAYVSGMPALIGIAASQGEKALAELLKLAARSCLLLIKHRPDAEGAFRAAFQLVVEANIAAHQGPEGSPSATEAIAI